MSKVPMREMQLSLWEEEKPVLVENFIECIHFNGSREIVSTLDSSTNWRDMTVWSAQFTTREKYEEQKRKANRD